LSESEIQKALVERGSVSQSKAEVLAKLARGSYWDAHTLIDEDIEGKFLEVANYLRNAIGGKQNSNYGIIENITTNKERREVQRWLEILQLWLRDALILQKGMNVNFVSEKHQIDLKNFCLRIPRANLIDAVQCVDKCIQMIDQYIYPTLLLIGLSIELKKYFPIQS
jgi:hypothetical protein